MPSRWQLLWQTPAPTEVAALLRKAHAVWRPRKRSWQEPRKTLRRLRPNRGEKAPRVDKAGWDLEEKHRTRADGVGPSGLSHTPPYVHTVLTKSTPWKRRTGLRERLSRAEPLASERLYQKTHWDIRQSSRIWQGADGHGNERHNAVSSANTLGALWARPVQSEPQYQNSTGGETTRPKARHSLPAHHTAVLAGGRDTETIQAGLSWFVKQRCDTGYFYNCQLWAMHICSTFIEPSLEQNLTKQSNALKRYFLSIRVSLRSVI